MGEVSIYVKLWLMLAAVWAVGSAIGMVGLMTDSIDPDLMAGWVFGGLMTLVAIATSGLAVSVWMR